MSPTPLVIKTKALGRLVKEKQIYEDELKQEQSRLEELMKNKPETEDFDYNYKLKVQVQLLEESQKMIPALATKIAEHANDLSKYVNDYEGPEDLTEAKGLLQEVAE